MLRPLLHVNGRIDKLCQHLHGAACRDEQAQGSQPCASWGGHLRSPPSHPTISLEEASLLAACPRPGVSGSAGDAHPPLPHLPFITAGLDLDLSHLDAPQWQPRASTVRGLAHGRTISVTGNRKHTFSPCGPSCALPRLQPSTLPAHSARKGIPTTATSVAARLVHQMRSAMLRDWQRVRGRNSLAAPGRRRLLLHLAERQAALHQP